MENLKVDQLKILIVDDEPANVKLLQMVLEFAGFANLRSTTDARQALPLFREFEPDLVLLDLSMPHLDGFQVMAQLRGFIPPATYVPILVLTAMVGTDIKRKALASGATDFLTKPLDNIEVLLRVKNLLQTRALYLEMQSYNDTLEQTVKERTLELREALLELRQTQQQVVQQERMHALQVMAGGVAHDFNNALSIILGFGELVLADCLENPELSQDADAMRAIVTAAQGAAQMVSRLGEFTRKESSEVRETVDLNVLVRQALSLTQPRWKTQALGRGVSIEVQVESRSIPRISGDPVELREALTNLIFNAVDAMPEGGTIHLRTHAERGYVVLEVGDTGTGMSEEVRQRCLEPFFTTKGAKGTGLGLAVVYGIIQRHGGMMTVHSQAGKGTTFLLRLPEFAEVASLVPELVSTREEQLRVLVVDDQAILRDIIAQYLEQDWHQVETARDGIEALRKFDAGRFDVVITDQAMPETSGDQLVAAIKQRAPDQRVMMLTGFGAKENAGGNIGADVVLGKPITREALRRGIAKLMMVRS